MQPHTFGIRSTAHSTLEEVSYIIYVIYVQFELKQIYLLMFNMQSISRGLSVELKNYKLSRIKKKKNTPFATL